MGFSPLTVALNGDLLVDAVGGVHCSIPSDAQTGKFRLYVNDTGMYQFYTSDGFGWSHAVNATSGYIYEAVEVQDVMYSDGSASFDYGANEYSLMVAESVQALDVIAVGEYAGSYLGKWSLSVDSLQVRPMLATQLLLGFVR